MTHSHSLTSLLRLSLLSLLAGLTGWAQTTRTWDGNTDANLGGNWSLAANWSDDNVPDTGNSTGENAFLPDVTTGTRTVTNDATHTIYRLLMTQTSVGGVNSLSLDAPLQITSTTAYSTTANAPLLLTPTAGLSSLVVDLNSQSLTITAPAIGGTSNTEGATLNGTWSIGSGGSLNLVYTSNQSPGKLTNKGTITQDGAATNLNFAVASGNNDGTGVGRRFDNQGTWELTNASSINFTGYGGIGGFGIGTNNLNSGTLKILSGSSVEFASLINTGTIELGSNGMVGSTDNSTKTLNNNAGGLLQITGSGTTFLNTAGSATLRNNSGGQIAFANGSSLTIPHRTGGTAIFDNAGGTIVQDNATLTFDWNDATNNNVVSRFTNSGTWTLSNGARIAFQRLGSDYGGGFGVASGNSNSGTMHILDNSQVDFANLTNTGTINLGNAGSDVKLSIIANGPSLTNGANGIVNVNGTTVFGHNTELNTTLFDNGTSGGSTGGQLNVNGGTFTIVGGQATLTSRADNAVTVASGATLAIKAYDDGLPHPHNTRSARFVNAGQLTLAGKLQFADNHYGINGLTSSGLVAISGNSAEFERLPNASTGYSASTFSNTGTINGNGTLTYINSTGNSSVDKLTLTNAGTIAPRNSIGTLEFVNTNLSFLAGSVYEFEASSATNHDLVLVTEGNLTLAAGWVLHLVRLSGYSWPGETFTLFEVDGGSISLGTPSVLFDPADRWGGTPLVSVVDNQVVLSGVYIIPEPSSLALLALGLLAIRRRR